jgi:hypothetical protein
MAEDLNINFDEWKTDFNRVDCDVKDFRTSRVWPKDMHPAIHKPEFDTVSDAQSWMHQKEPVISVVIKNKARAYPLGILLFHEIINDKLSGVPLAVSYCPLCNTAIVFDRRIEEKVYSFGVAGVLRNSNLVMYDRTTETWWQQLTGQGLIGEHAGIFLEKIPSQVISFEQFSIAYPEGKILKPYFWGKNRYYPGYDSARPGMLPKYCPEDVDTSFPPMERMITLTLKDKSRIYPFFITKKEKVINDKVSDLEIVVFHIEGAVSPVDKPIISESRETGSTGVFIRKIDGRTLTFEYRDGKLLDIETSSTWDITGRAVSGELAGNQLPLVVHSNDFWFVWSIFHPSSDIYK